MKSFECRDQTYIGINEIHNLHNLVPLALSFLFLRN